MLLFCCTDVVVLLCSVVPMLLFCCVLLYRCCCSVVFCCCSVVFCCTDVVVLLYRCCCSVVPMLLFCCTDVVVLLCSVVPMLLFCCVLLYRCCCSVVLVVLFSCTNVVDVLEPRHVGARAGPHPHRHERKLSLQETELYTSLVLPNLNCQTLFLLVEIRIVSQFTRLYDQQINVNHQAIIFQISVSVGISTTFWHNLLLKHH